MLEESLLGDKVKLLKESSLGDRVKLFKKSLLGDKVEMPKNFPFISYLQRYGIGQLSLIKEKLPPLINTFTKPFYI